MLRAIRDGALEDVRTERARQVQGEGYDDEHDDYEHAAGDLAIAAACYALPPAMRPADGRVPSLWPWDTRHWKPKDRRRELVIAGGLILAEIERMDRQTALYAVSVVRCQP